MVKSTAEAVNFYREALSEVWESAVHLIYQHHKEVGCLPHEEFRPSREAYEVMERAGCLETFTMRREGELVGYCAFSVFPPHPHYINRRWIREDAIYVVPKWRGSVAADFQVWNHEQLRAKYPGCDILRSSTARHDRAAMLVRMGFRKIEETWILERDPDWEPEVL